MSDENNRPSVRANEVSKQRHRAPDPELPNDATPIVPLRDMVLFPAIILPVAIGREDSIAASQYAIRQGKPIGLLLQRDPNTDTPRPGDLYQIGTNTSILRYITAPDGTHHIVCQGNHRFRVTEFLQGFPFLVAKTTVLAEPEEHVTAEVEAFALHLKEALSELINLSSDAPTEFGSALEQIRSPSNLCDLTATFVGMTPPEKQEILETLELKPRIEKILKFVSRKLQVLRLSREIGEQTRQSISENQRKFLLGEQLKTIQKQLGETDEHTAEIAELSEAIAKSGMPPDVENQARRELKRLERMSELSGEYSIARTYLDWLIELPWRLNQGSVIDITKARSILDEDHYGLEKVKNRILEYLAVRKLKPDGRSPILCFAGPPGVGKTSLGRSIARAIGRDFARVSLGGVHDESEIRGHRRTYVAALPGNIIQTIRKIGARDCVLMLDEVDKLGSGFQGDPAAALLEVLDPEQNFSFQDHYLGVPFDLSHILFIATANLLESVPAPLQDRMEVIRLPGYTEEEKVQIARRYLIGRQAEACGLSGQQCTIEDEAIRQIITSYTREAGVRELERCIGAIFRSCAMQIAEDGAAPASVAAEMLRGILGPVRYESEIALMTSVPGVATGLAWTPAGGDILFIETRRVTGSGKLIMTGQLGEVMKESAQAALSLVKAKLEILHLQPDILEHSDVHIHVPAGATPKDGPSAGVAIFVALYSMLADRPVRNDVAMSGEISLRGQILPVGGIKEKILAAVRAGIFTILLPRRNQNEVDEIPVSTRQLLEFLWLDTVDDAVRHGLRAP